jgi:hypothetical protein
MKKYIKELVKHKIISQIVGIKLPHRGLEKRFIKFKEWGHLRFDFIPDFDPASIPVNGQVTTSVHFNIKGVLELKFNKSEESFGAYFGPIKVFIENSNYQIDCINASFYRFETD